MKGFDIMRTFEIKFKDPDMDKIMDPYTALYKACLEKCTEYKMTDPDKKKWEKVLKKVDNLFDILRATGIMDTEFIYNEES